MFVIVRDFAPRPAHPQGDSAAAQRHRAATADEYQFDVLAALLSFSNKPARSLRTVANFEK